MDNLSDISKSEEFLSKISLDFLKNNYDYVWLKAMLCKASKMKSGGTLCVGSSHPLVGINESYWENCVNGSMHSQDLYYDYLFIKTALDNGGYFDKCIIMFGYYICFQDLSLAVKLRQHMLGDIYYPLYGDARNWADPIVVDKWEKYNVSENVKNWCENIVVSYLMQQGTYFSDLKKRKPFFNFNGRLWSELSKEEHLEFGQKRASDHNRLYSHVNSYTENIPVFEKMISLLCKYNIRPIVAIPPFTREYSTFVNDEMRKAVRTMIDIVASKVDSDIDFIDFNDENLFNAEDFIDTDHLNHIGAHKFSRYLVELFGK